MSKSAEGRDPDQILVTMGEPAGIGPEIALQAYEYFKGRVGRRTLRLVGDPKIFGTPRSIPSGSVLATKHRAHRSAGKPDPANSAAVCEAISLATSLAMKGECAAIVTGPINKAVLAKADFPFPGHTEFLAHLTGARRAVMMLAGADLRVVPLTVHMPLGEVTAAITQDAIIETSQIILSSLKGDFALASPRLAIAG
ncbi:MAG: 4-hydroxythreonine-4-phosphate dehydrogenase PdxA, partial [Alphaproteobacteria bacterium]|nr:4-hydroxythreonine-4-phosphate dehydrogenase PdxA [Alphaproteobacteria bacterium]